MSLLRTKLADPAYVGSSPGAVVTNAAGEKTYVRSLWLFNANTTTETVKGYMVPDNSSSVGTAAQTNQLFEEEIPAKQWLEVEPKHPWVLTDTNDTIQAEATTASKVVVVPSGDIDDGA